MQYPATALLVLVPVGHAALMRVDSAFGLLHPRGGMIMPGISMALACAAIRMTGRSSRVREPSVRFQWAAAGWIWLVV